MHSVISAEELAHQIEGKYGKGNLNSIWKHGGKVKTWESYFKGAPEGINDLHEIEKGDKLWIFINCPETYTQVPVAYDPPVLTLISEDDFTKGTIGPTSWSGQISKAKVKELFIERFGPVCWGCGFDARRPNGSVDLTILEVDHIRARKASGLTPGDDELYNLAILHRSCNLRKTNKMSLEELRKYNAENGLLYVDSVAELVDLFEVIRYAFLELNRRAAKLGEGAFLVLD